ncbi:hypothetical protein [Gimesia sp.]|uniref:hypothetical protein n=1 Tax=Gimesia sp. TaxID=2024833 RepID=UPI003A946A14
MAEDLNWKEKIAETLWKVKTGERAEGLRQAAVRFNNVNSHILSTREKLYGKEVTDNNRPEGEEMHIGDDNSVIHQYLPSQQQGSIVGSLAKLAMGAGLITMGVGVPIGGYLIADALANYPASAIETDTNTEYEVTLEP